MKRSPRVKLTEAIGADLSPDITIDGQKDTPLPQTLTLSIDSLIDRAMANRPDLQAQAAEIRAADNAIRQAKAAYRPQIALKGSGAQTIVWPTADFGELGPASEPTWSVTLGIEWQLWDGGARKNQLAIAQSKRREAQDEMTELRDQATREVWTAYIAFRTAVRKEQAAEALLDSASTSYSASLEAYQYGVKNLVDVLTAEKQLAQARLSGVSARSQLFLEAVNLEFATGNLLRSQPPATTPQSVEDHILGSFFPAWMICLTAGVVLAFVVRFILLRYRLETEVGPLAFFYPCVVILSTCLLWLIFFR